MVSCKWFTFASNIFVRLQSASIYRLPLHLMYLLKHCYWTSALAAMPMNQLLTDTEYRILPLLSAVKNHSVFSDRFHLVELLGTSDSMSILEDANSQNLLWSLVLMRLLWIWVSECYLLPHYIHSRWYDALSLRMPMMHQCYMHTKGMS